MPTTAGPTCWATDATAVCSSSRTLMRVDAPRCGLVSSDLQVTTARRAAQPSGATIPGMQEPSSTRAPATHASPLAAALDRVGDRWRLLLVEALLDGPRRFNELSGVVSGIAANILSDRLRRLERAGILRATPYSHRPVRMEYALTADGAELAGALRLLADWGARQEG